MTFHPKCRDSQNPYRTGVLNGNFVEDGFGRVLAEVPRQGGTGISENKAKQSLGSTLMAYDIPARTQDSILVSKFIPSKSKLTDHLAQNDKDQTDYADHMGFRQHAGVKHHLLIGHGPDQDRFEKRDVGTTSACVYDKLQTTNQLINPNTYEGDQKNLSLYQTNSQVSDLPVMFSNQAAATQVNTLKFKSYNDFTKTFDNNSNKIGLRQ